MTDPATARSTAVATGATVGRGAAIWNALGSRKVDFYPRVAEGGVISTLDTLQVLQDVGKASTRWSRLDDNDALKTAIDLAKQSLAEVKAQTEYQDQMDEANARPDHIVATFADVPAIVFAGAGAARHGIFSGGMNVSD